MIKPTLNHLQLTPNSLLLTGEAHSLVDHLRQGGVVVLPTETGYLIGVDALNQDAVRLLYHIKQRSLSNPIHVAVSSVDMAAEYVQLNAEAERLFDAFLPGPLTIIAPKRDVISDLLVAGTGNLGIRIPDCPVVIQIAQMFGRPITATSLNPAGQAESPTVEETIRRLEWSRNSRSVMVVSGREAEKYGCSSTVVSCATVPCSILRSGPISEADIRAVVAKWGYCDVREFT